MAQLSDRRVCKLQTGWIGLQLIIDWVLMLPVTLLLAVVGVVLSEYVGFFSAKLYQWAKAESLGTL